MKTSMPKPEPVAQPRSFQRRISGKFTQSLDAFYGLVRPQKLQKARLLHVFAALRKVFRGSRNENKVVEQKVVLAMVGLPARGKSYISKAIVRYLSFCGCPTRLFNAGNLRRESGQQGVAADFFDHSNADGKRQRDAMAMECLDQVLEFLEACGRATAVGFLGPVLRFGRFAFVCATFYM